MRKIVAATGVDHRARSVDDEARALAVATDRDRCFHVTALRADAGHQERHVADDFAHIGNHLRHGRADHEAHVVVAVPLVGRELRDTQVQGFSIDHLLLQIGPTFVRSAAEQDHALVGIFRERRDRIATEVGVHGHRVGTITFKRLYGVELRRTAHVAAFRVKNHRHMRIAIMDVINRRRKLVFGSDGGVMSELRFVGADDIVRRVDDRFVERKNCIRTIEQTFRQTLFLGVKSDADKRARFRPGGL